MKYISSKIKNLNFNKLVGKVFSKSKYPLIFTLHSNYKSEVLVNNLKKINNKAKWVVLPHGTLIANNKMLIDSDLNKKEVTKSKNKNSKFDFICTPVNMMSISRLYLKMKERKNIS